MELQIPEFSIIDIKFDGPSFEGVIDITALWNELLWLEYCLRQAFRKIRDSDKKFSEVLDTDFIILVEPFEKNCFRKKLKLTTIRKEINKLTGKEIAVLVGAWTIIAQLIPPTISWVYTLIKDFTVPEIQQITSANISPELIKKIGDQTKLELLSDQRFRKELATIAMPLVNPDDNTEIRTKDIEWKERLVTIGTDTKDNFLAVAWIERITKVDELYLEKSEVLYGRINAIDVDATKRQLWFKLNWEWKEIDCYLSWSQVVTDYIKLVGKWVSIEWIVAYRWANPEKIEVIRITESEPPLREYYTAPMNF